LSRNETEAWNKWVSGQARDREQSSALVPHTRAIGPSRLCKIFWPEDISRDQVSDEEIIRARVEGVRTDNVSPRKRSVPIGTIANSQRSGMQPRLESHSQSISLSPTFRANSQRREKLSFMNLP
jgi:hypothetical protein